MMELGSQACLVFLSVLLVSGTVQATFPFCRIRTLTDIASLQGDLSYPHLLEDDCTPRAIEVARPNIREAQSLCRKGSCMYCASLFYAEWCPFSRSTRQVFDQLSILFPDICHLAVESSNLWPSELFEHGVRNMPTLFLHNKSMRFQFHGPRLLTTLSQFYEEKTGLASVPLSFDINEMNTLPRRQDGLGKLHWKNRLAAWVWNEIGLVFAIFFVLLRSFLYIQPKVVGTFKRCWLLKGITSRAPVRNPNIGTAEQTRQELVAGKTNGKCLRRDDRESGKVVLSVSSWPSSSFAAVALAECSSRAATTEDANKKTVNGA